MNKSTTYLIVASIVLVVFSSSRCEASLEDWSTWGVDNTFYGYLTIEEINIDGTIIGTPGLDPGLEAEAGGSWDNDDTKLTWSVTTVDDDSDGNVDYFHYKYIFEDGGALAPGALSHLSIEVSQAVPGGLGAFTLDDVSNPTIDGDDYPFDDVEADIEVGWNNDADIPSSLYSLKFDSVSAYAEDGKITMEFDSMRVPMWGDFFAKDGDPAGYAYNTGFGLTPTAANLAEYGFIGRPDTEVIPVPPAVILGMLGMGIAGIKLRKYA